MTLGNDQTVAEAEVDDDIMEDDEDALADREDGSDPDDAEDLDDRLEE